MSTMEAPRGGTGFSADQKEYLSGLFAGIAARGQRFSDAEQTPGASEKPANEDLIFEERVKRELHPLDAYGQILENAIGNKVPDKEETFRFKWNGLFFLTPVKDAFMARLRIPGFSSWEHDPLWATVYDWSVEHPSVGRSLWRLGAGSSLKTLYAACLLYTSDAADE